MRIHNITPAVRRLSDCPLSSSQGRSFANWRIHNIMLNGRRLSWLSSLVLSRKIVRINEGYIILCWLLEDCLIALSCPFKEDRSPKWGYIILRRLLEDCLIALSRPFKEDRSPNWRIHNIMLNGRRLPWLPSLVLSRKIVRINEGYIILCWLLEDCLIALSSFQGRSFA